MKDQKIISGCRKGREDAFRQLVEKYASMLMGVCLRYMKERPAAEDALQDTFIVIFKSIDQYRGTGEFGGWLRRIAVTTCLKELRRNGLETIDIDSLQHVSGFENDPEIESALAFDHIMSIVNGLPDHYRIVFNMYVVEGYDHGEIAEMLEIKESNSRARLTRARALVRDAYTKKNMTYESAKARKVHSG